MLKILFIVPLLIVLLLSGLACRHIPLGNDYVRSSPSPSPSESRDSSRPEPVTQQPQVQVRLNGLALGMSMDSATAKMNAEGFRVLKMPDYRYDFVTKETGQHYSPGPSIVVDENDLVVEVSSNRAICFYLPAIEFTGPDGTMGQLKWDAHSKEIVEKLGEPQQKTPIGKKGEYWAFPRLGLVLSISNSDHSLFAARLKKSDKK